MHTQPYGQLTGNQPINEDDVINFCYNLGKPLQGQRLTLAAFEFFPVEEVASLPIYTYACEACGRVIERRQSFSDSPLTVCDGCGGSLRRVLHPVGIIFKGSGFYNTDYKRSSAANGSGGDRKDDVVTSSSGGSTGEASS